MGRDERINPTRLRLAEDEDNQVVREARGRVLKEDDEIILNVPGPVYFRVAQITPVLDPKAPPGLVHIHVGCMLTFTAKVGSINREFVRVRSKEEAGPSQFKLLDATPVDGPES